MNPALRLKQIILVIGDIAILYGALALALIIRYRAPLTSGAFINHLQPFSILFALWIIIFYINGLYEIHKLKNTPAFIKNLGAAVTVGTLIAIIFFYLITDYGIAPKTNLFIFLVVSFVCIYIWRSFYNNFVGRHLPMTAVTLLGANPFTAELTQTIRHNPQLGYRMVNAIESADLIVVPAHFKHDPRVTRTLYHYATAGVEVMDTIAFYELLMQKLPVHELEDTWFLRHLVNRHTIYDFFRLPTEIFCAAFLLVVSLPLTAVIAVLVKLTSRGPIIFKQVRVGEFGKQFTLYKFRSMIANAPDGSAEAVSGPQWKTADDPRFTALGRIIERTHLDELPQLVNIVKGEVSFVGPRPERPAFVTQLKEKMPFYELRHLVKPGIAGWAQLHYSYGSSVNDAYEKLQYDLYYLKNRSFWLDLGIIIKTIKLFFTKP